MHVRTAVVDDLSENIHAICLKNKITPSGTSNYKNGYYPSKLGSKRKQMFRVNYGTVDAAASTTCLFGFPTCKGFRNQRQSPAKYMWCSEESN